MFSGNHMFNYLKSLGNKIDDKDTGPRLIGTSQIKSSK